MTTEQQQLSFVENSDNRITPFPYRHVIVISHTRPYFGYCCCCSLRTGNLVAGWTGIVIAVLALFIWIVDLSLKIAGNLEKSTAPAGILIVLSLLTIPDYSLILIGVYKKNPNCLQAFVIITSIGLVLSFILLSLIIMIGFPLALIFIMIRFHYWIAVVEGIIIGLTIPAIFYVNSYRMQLINELAGSSDSSDLDA